MKGIGGITISVGVILCLATLTLSAPATQHEKAETKAVQPKSVSWRTFGSSSSSSTMDNIKEMFDWSNITWVPLGQLIFGSQGDGSLGIAKWPLGGSSSSSSNSNKNGK